MSATPPEPKPDLLDAADTDEIYSLAFRLAAWGLRHGECDEANAEEWVLGHTHEDKLPRGSRRRLQSTERHVRKGAEHAAGKFIPGLALREFDHDRLHDLAARVAGSKCRDERYLLGAIALGHRYRTTTPVITGPLLAEVVGVNDATAGRVLKRWSDTLGCGFFTGVKYDGERGHGRVWAIDSDWQPPQRSIHAPGCNRSRSRCSCRKIGDLSLAGLSKIDRPKCDTLDAWLSTLQDRAPVTVTDVCRRLGWTRAVATAELENAMGRTLDTATRPAGRARKRGPNGNWYSCRQGRTWFVAKAEAHEAQAKAAARVEAVQAAHAARRANESVCFFVDCDDTAAAGQLYCPTHHDLMAEASA